MNGVVNALKSQPDVAWNSNSINGNQYLKAINQCTMDMENECHLKQIVNRPTRGDNISMYP